MSRRLLLFGFYCFWVGLLGGAVLQAQAPPSAPAGKVRVACVGDSITYGSGLAHRETDSYPAVLQRLLGEAYEVKNFGVSGATLLKSGDKPYWKESAYHKVEGFEPNTVIIKLGTNDTKPQNWSQKAAFADDLRALIDHFASLRTKPRVWVCLPVPVHKPNFGINQPALDEQLGLIKSVAEEKGVSIIDLFTALKSHPEYFPDGIHPNADGAALMAQTVHAALLKTPVQQKR